MMAGVDGRERNGPRRRSSFLYATAVLGVVAVTGAVSCRRAGAGADAAVDVEPDRDPNCHWDCFGRAECLKGKVTVWEHTPVPCELWQGQCPVREQYTCSDGCRIDPTHIDYPFLFDARVLCAETPSAKVGDRCRAAGPCLPTPVKKTDGGVEVQHLECNGGACIEVKPPEVPGWMKPCDGSTSFGTSGYTEGGSACRYCLLNVTPTCRQSGCTIPCWGDHQCPAGATCDDSLLSLAERRDESPVCRHGLRGTPLALPCHTDLDAGADATDGANATDGPPPDGA